MIWQIARHTTETSNFDIICIIYLFESYYIVIFLRRFFSTVCFAVFFYNLKFDKARNVFEGIFCEVSYKAYPRWYYYEYGCRILTYDEETRE